MDFILFSVQTMVLTIGINHGMPIRHLVVWSWDDSVLVSSLSIVDTLRETETYGSAKSLLQKSCRQLKCMLIKWNGWKTDLIIGTTALLDPSNLIIFFSYMLRSFLWSVHHPIDSWDWWKRSSVHKRIGKNEIWWCKSVCVLVPCLPCFLFIGFMRHEIIFEGYAFEEIQDMICLFVCFDGQNSSP